MRADQQPAAVGSKTSPEISPPPSVGSAPAPLHFQPLAERWSVALSAPPAGPPLISGDIVVVALQPSGIVAFRGVDGSQAWRCDLATDRPLAHDGERVYVVAADSIHAVSISNGEELWRQKSAALTAPLLVHAGWVVAASQGNIAAYRAADGSPVWQRAIGVVEYLPAIDGDVLFVPLLEREVAALDLQTGEPLWTAPLEGEPGEPLALAERVYIGARDKRFYTLKAADGDVDWVQRVGAGPRGRPALDDDRVYVVALDNIVNAYDRQSGARRWNKGLKYRPFGGPVLMSGAVVVPGPTHVLPVYRRENGDALAELTFAATLVGMSNVLFGPWNYPMFAAVTGDLQHPWTLTFLEPSTDPPPITLVDLVELPGTTIPIGLPQ